MNTEEAAGKTALNIAMAVRAQCKCIESKPFNKKEAEVFCTHFKIEALKVNYNPLYLTFYIGSLEDKSILTSGLNSVTMMRDTSLREIAHLLESMIDFCPWYFSNRKHYTA